MRAMKYMDDPNHWWSMSKIRDETSGIRISKTTTNKLEQKNPFIQGSKKAKNMKIPPTKKVQTKIKQESFLTHKKTNATFSLLSKVTTRNHTTVPSKFTKTTGNMTVNAVMTASQNKHTQPPKMSKETTMNHQNNVTTVATAVSINNSTRDLRYFLSNSTTLLQDIIPNYRHYDPDSTRGTYPPPPCGFFKCWFPSQHYNGYGYTIGQYASKMNTYSVDIMWDAYRLVQRLGKEIQEQHPSLPPFRHLYHPDIPPVVLAASVSKDLHAYLRQEFQLATGLNDGTVPWKDVHGREDNAHDGMTKEHWSTRSQPRPTTHSAIDSTAQSTKTPSTPMAPHKFRSKNFARNKHFLVQLCLAIPHNSLLWYTPSQNGGHAQTWTVTKEWLHSIHWQLLHSATGDISTAWHTFDNTLQQYVNQTVTLLDMEPTIAWDFQLAIAPDGVIWHFDMDRALGHDVYNKMNREAQTNKLQQQVRSVGTTLQNWYQSVHENVQERIAEREKEKMKMASQRRYVEWKQHLRHIEKTK